MAGEPGPGEVGGQRQHANVSQTRLLPKTSTDSVRSFGGIAVWNPVARDRVKNHCLAKSVSATGCGSDRNRRSTTRSLRTGSNQCGQPR
jgi:hypothetical protein